MSFLYGLAGFGDRKWFGDGLFNRNDRQRRGRSGDRLRGDSGCLQNGGRDGYCLNCGRRDCGRPGCSRLDWRRLFGDAGRLLAQSGRGSGRPDDHGCRRGHNNKRPGGSGCAGGRPGNYCAAGWAGGNCRGGRGRDNNGWRGTRLRHNFARLGPGRRCRRRSNDWSLRVCGPDGGGNRWRLGAHSCMALPRFLLFLLLVGQNGLHHITGLGDVGEIDFGLQPLWSARRCAALGAAPGIALKLRANLVRFVVFQRTGVGFAARQAEFRQ